MQCKVIRDDLEVSPSAIVIFKASQLEQVEFREILRNRRMVKVPFFKCGAVIKDEKAFRLVQLGYAIPDDDECREAAGMNALQMVAAQKAIERTIRGIHPDDFSLFDAGVIAGYQPDANWDGGPEEKYIPGPNWHLLKRDAEEDDEEEDDE
jgi:hypothetical protein